MRLLEPIDINQQSLVMSSTHYYINAAANLFNRQFPLIPVNFKLTGRAAGMYHVHRHKRYIRYNPYLFAKYFDDNLRNTVPHEVAHYIADMVYGINNIKPHGREWRAIMRQFGVEARASCNYDLQGIPHRQHRRFTYQCLCRSYEISTRRHNMIIRGQRCYRCPVCKTDIRYSGRI